MKKLLATAFIFFLLSSVAACQEQKPRYISLAPSTTEILFAIGLDDEIVGVSTYCNYPSQALKKEKMGEFSHPNIEKIVSLKPDYVFCTGLEQAQTITELKRLGLKVYVADPATVEDLLISIVDIGKITNKEYKAQIVVKQIIDMIDAVREKVVFIPQEKKVKVFIEIWHDPLTTAGLGSYVDELLNIAGGINIANDTKRPFSVFSPEEVINRNPDCIIMAYMDKTAPVKAVTDRFAWGTINAIKNNRVYNDINPDLLLRPGPRIGQAVLELYKHLYPDNGSKAS